MKHSIASVSLSGTLIEKIKAVAKAGYDGIELFENDLLVANISPLEVNKITTDLGLEIVGLQPFRDYEAMPEPYKSRSLERAKHKFDLMHALGTKKLFICSNTSIHTINSLDKAAEDLFDIAEIAKQHDFEIGYEALSWGRFVNTYHQSVEIVKRANHANLGNILDNFHISALKSTFEDIYTIPKDKFTIVQVADAPNFDMGAMHLGRHYRSFPGQGSFPVVEFIKAVQATGYDGYLSHEIFSDEFRSSQIDPVALDGKRSLIWLESISKHKKESQINLKSIEFLEFATNDFCQNDLVKMLVNLGFVETFRHKIKNVSIYQLGGVNIVLNRQSEVQNVQQNTVCAVGFATENKQKIENWTHKLGYCWEKSKASIYELDIPAAKGIGNILYYFIDEKDLEKEFYRIEFNNIATTKIDNGITVFDHIGHSVSADFYLSNTLFYRALLGLDIEESLEILDPRGIVYSRVAKNTNENIRISLSSTRSQGTSIDKFVAQTGAGIQQIALQTQDIFLTAQSIKNHDLILSIPSNYYDDLRAKTQLSEEIIQKMKQFNILYDRQESGEFFHFYCTEINGLFIEIVQRKGLYNRYGEVNSQVRLAAQERERQ
ncbi:4-hydroxyphenylpyruvate dioxygenase [Arcicella aurantiaca]|uniref:3-dehydroshikimate dehydratase n=1 Tax=Arcicella aurantiaca TaxID=591202 RepID=A0A316DH20_9BACT|nr:sugar phosphate isomerase/epimerase and 4-hydroxyphenylpyruvate domain-containing protein [Arcicella aurantiaca]PWK17597.1 4-hydroxyphenylpyruvate dioxygenase [Arcicella aurantiaca]